MKQKAKNFCAIVLICILSILSLQSTSSTFVYAADESANEFATTTDVQEEFCSNQQNNEPLGDLPGERFSVAPTNTYVKDVLSGKGSYFSEIHNLFTCTGKDASRIAAYCLNPARTAPDTATMYHEYIKNNDTAFMTENKSGASAVLMYGYGGESSINNSCIRLQTPNDNIGGSYGIYVMNGKAQFGLLINGIFYHLDPLEAQAVTAAAIHKLNGSDISLIEDTSGGNYAEANDAFHALYQFGSWASRHIDEYGYPATNQLLNANIKASRSLDLFIKDKNGKLLPIPANVLEKDFNWSPYINNNLISFEVSYKAIRCESKLISSNKSGNTNHINYSHDTITEFPGVEFANGYYDYFEIKETSSNDIPVSVTYHALNTENFQTPMLGIIQADGSFQKGTGQRFTQNATITISADKIINGGKLDLTIDVPQAASFTPFYGDGDQADGSYNAGRFFYSDGYQDMVVSSPYSHLTSIHKTLQAQTEPITKAAFQIMKYSKTADGIETPLQGAGFMACNVKDLKQASGVYQFDKRYAITLCRDGSTELFTDAKGYACSIPLEEGQYLIHETTVPANHFATEDFVVTITKGSPDLLPIVECIDAAFQAYIRIYKIDAYSRLPIKNNPATFRIWSVENECYVNFASKDEPCYDLQTDADGFLKTPIPLTAGNYRIEEICAPKGYYCTTGNMLDFTIHKDISYETYEDNTFGYSFDIENTPMYGAIEIHKTGEKRTYKNDTHAFSITELPLSDITFDIYAAKAIYSADGNFSCLYECGDLVDTLVTNEDGYACSTADLPIGSYYLHERTPSDYVEFEDTPFDITPEDTIIEQNVDNAIFKKIVKTFTIHNRLKIPMIETSAFNTKSNSKTAIPAKDDIISDAIHYNNLIVGNTYTIKGMLMDKATEQPLTVNGEMVTAEASFICEQPDGQITLDFKFDSSLLAGMDIVLYEKLYFDNEIVCVHEDINNAKQTITYEAPPVTHPPVNTPPSGSPPKEEPPVIVPPTEGPKTGDQTPITPIIIVCACTFLSFLIFFFKNQIYKFLKKYIVK